MEIASIVSALRHHKAGAVLLALQIGLTVAIVCNTLTIIKQYMDQTQRPSGIDEPNIFTMYNQWVGDPPDLESRVLGDLAALRSLPDVVGAEAAGGYPLNGSGAAVGISRHPDQHYDDAWTTAVYYVDEQGQAAYGVKLVAGRWFRRDEISIQHSADASNPAVIILTEWAAKFFFPDGNAVGRLVYLASPSPSRVIGVVERMETPWAGLPHMDSFVERSVFLPYRYVSNGLWYVVHSRQGEQAEVMKAAQEKLYAMTPARVIDDVVPFSETRQRIYAHGRSSSLMLGALSVLLLTVTAFGVVGLTSYWVAQRRRQIGMRRALGARRMDILRYFHTENVLVAGSGAVLGIGLCLAGNLWLAHKLALTRVSPEHICVAALIVMGLSQMAVLWPALRAAAIPAAAAIRDL
ncbi:MAG TPA: FtsX-like permease family protein [Steroidobacteraceae bacterium]|nr:FtsX-like permease family protein [Steroidobacteraceae bacterium]